jgi:glycosyltransferase involved in cell wall biosynthesis
MNNVELSVGLPVYNGKKYIEEAIESILRQDLDGFELIISDNASEDGTAEICRYYSKRDERVRYYANSENMGAAWNYNRTFQLANGKYFKWAAHDDVCLPGYFRRCVETLRDAPESVVMVYTRSEFVDADRKFLSANKDVVESRLGKAHARLAHVLRNMSMANAVFGVMRYEALKKTRLIDSFISSDYVLLAELAMLGEIWEVPEVFLQRRLHGGGSRFANRTNQEVAKWFDPRQKLRLGLAHSLFPNTMARARLVYEWMHSTVRIRMPLSERVMCFFTVPLVYGVVRLRNSGGMWKRRLKKWIPF